MLGLGREVGAAAPEIWKGFGSPCYLEQGRLLLQAHGAGTGPSSPASCAGAEISLEQ